MARSRKEKSYLFRTKAQKYGRSWLLWGIVSSSECERNEKRDERLVRADVECYVGEDGKAV